MIWKIIMLINYFFAFFSFNALVVRLSYYIFMSFINDMFETNHVQISFVFLISYFVETFNTFLLLRFDFIFNILFNFVHVSRMTRFNFNDFVCAHILYRGFFHFVIKIVWIRWSNNFIIISCDSLNWIFDRLCISFHKNSNEMILSFLMTLFKYALSFSKISSLTMNEKWSFEIFWNWNELWTMLFESRLFFRFEFWYWIIFVFFCQSSSIINMYSYYFEKFFYIYLQFWIAHKIVTKFFDQMITFCWFNAFIFFFFQI